MVNRNGIVAGFETLDDDLYAIPGGSYLALCHLPLAAGKIPGRIIEAVLDGPFAGIESCDEDMQIGTVQPSQFRTCKTWRSQKHSTCEQSRNRAMSE